MSGSIVTLRTSGVPSGYPAEIDADVKIRSVDNLLVNMRDDSVALLKLLGGTSSFVFNNTKREWVEDDLWSRRLTGATTVTTTLTLATTGTGHRYPVGTLIFNVRTGEIMRVTAVAADTLTIQADVTGDGTAGSETVATDELKVCGQAMAANADYVMRPGAILTLPYNYGQVMHEGIEVTFDRMEMAQYGLQGTDLDYLAANCTAEMFVKQEGMLLDGIRYVGASAARPALAGGIKFYVTAANGAKVSDLSDASFTRKDLDDVLQDRWSTVGPEKMARLCLVSPWAKRKVSSWFSSAERLAAGATSGGVVIDRVNTDFGVVEFMLLPALNADEVLLVNKEMISMGCHGNLGRPHLMVPAGISVVGPKVQRFYYAHLTVQCKGVQGMARIHNFSLTA